MLANSIIRRLFPCALAMFIVDRATAAVVITAREFGNDVVFEAVGTLDLTDLVFVPPTLLGGRTGLAGISFTSPPSFVRTASGPYDSYSGIVEYPTIFGTEFYALQQPDATTGDLVGAHTFLDVPAGYVSGAPITASMLFEGETFDSMNLTEGEYTWRWGTGPNADSLTVRIVPEPDLVSYAFVAGWFSLLRRRPRSKALNRSEQDGGGQPATRPESR